MIIDCNLIAYEFQKDQFTPKAVEKSGEKDTDKAIFSTKTPDNAVLIIENDIVNDEGKGLKKGFYNVKPDKYLDNLLIFQTGVLKAKVPVVNLKVIETANPKQTKVQKMGVYSYQKYLEKEEKKYSKGENPNKMDFKTAELRYNPERNVYVLIYNSNIVELVGIIKF